MRWFTELREKRDFNKEGSLPYDVSNMRVETSEYCAHYNKENIKNQNMEKTENKNIKTSQNYYKK